MAGVPLKPPASYRDEIVRYLHLEFGESDDDPEALKASDLKFAGLYAVDDVPTYYWSYPVSRGKPQYATWEVYANTYGLGMTGDPPDPAARILEASQCPELRTLDLPPSRARPWWRRGPLGVLFGAGTVAMMLWAMVRTIRRMRKTTDRLAVLPLPEILPQWLSAMDLTANDSSVHLRDPASREQVALAERRLGHPLPASIAEFYLRSDGVRWHNPIGYEQLPPLAELRHGRDVDPPLSARLQRHWEDNDREDGEPQSLQVGNDDFKGMLNAEPFMVDFAALDDMLVISRPDEANFLVALVAPVGGLPAGNVLQVEGTRATRYDDLAHWFAGQVAIYGSMQEMQKRIRG